jgi:hypothetical protein
MGKGIEIKTTDRREHKSHSHSRDFEGNDIELRSPAKDAAAGRERNFQKQSRVTRTMWLDGVFIKDFESA